MALHALKQAQLDHETKMLNDGREMYTDVNDELFTSAARSLSHWHWSQVLVAEKGPKLRSLRLSGGNQLISRPPPGQNSPIPVELEWFARLLEINHPPSQKTTLEKSPTTP